MSSFNHYPAFISKHTKLRSLIDQADVTPCLKKSTSPQLHGSLRALRPAQSLCAGASSDSPRMMAR